MVVVVIAGSRGVAEGWETVVVGPLRVARLEWRRLGSARRKSPVVCLDVESQN